MYIYINDSASIFLYTRIYAYKRFHARFINITTCVQYFCSEYRIIIHRRKPIATAIVVFVVVVVVNNEKCVRLNIHTRHAYYII